MSRIEVTREEFREFTGLDANPAAKSVTLYFCGLPYVEYIFIDEELCRQCDNEITEGDYCPDCKIKVLRDLAELNRMFALPDIRG